jgi:hypothetical protein
MLTLVEPEERRFTEMADLREALATQDRKSIEVPLSKLSFSKAGRLQAGQCEGRLAVAGLLGLLRTLAIPEGFARHVCPQDLLVTIVNRLAHGQDGLARVRLVDGVVMGVMPAKRQSIGHDMLIDWLGVTRPIEEATLAGEQLRILTVGTSARDLLPNDAFGFGWDLISGEDGWHATELWRLTIRQVCTNGAVGFDKTPAFRRAYNSNRPAMKSLADLRFAIDNLGEPPELEPAVRWAAEKHVGKEYEMVIAYLAQRLEGDTTRVALGEINADSSWYELVNRVTSLAKLHRIEMRRRYEVEGGMLLNWFARRGRTRPPWRRVLCEGCADWNAGSVSSEKDISRIGQTGEPSLFD